MNSHKTSSTKKLINYKLITGKEDEVNSQVENFIKRGYIPCGNLERSVVPGVGGSSGTSYKNRNGWGYIPGSSSVPGYVKYSIPMCLYEKE